MNRSGKEHGDGFKYSPKCTRSKDQMKMILEIYGDEFIDFEDEEIDINALENEEGNYSEAHTVCVEKSVGL